MCWGRQGSRAFGEVARLGQLLGSLLARREALPLFLEQVAVALLGPQRAAPLLVHRLAQDAAGVPLNTRWIEGAPSQGELLQAPTLLRGRGVILVVLLGVHEGWWCGDYGWSCRSIVRQC